MIPNIVKGKGISGALAYVMGQGNDAQTGKPLGRGKGEPSRATILGGQNFGFEIDSAERLELARKMMEFQALPQNQTSKTRKLDRDCLHASLSWAIGQEPTPEEMIEAAQSFLKSIGLEKARAVFVSHDDTDHRHAHIVASRIDPETGRSLLQDNDFIASQKWARDFDRAHGYDRDPPGGGGLSAVLQAVEKRDVEAVLAHLTRDKATFKAWEVNRLLSQAGLSSEERTGFRSEILAHGNVIGLREAAGEPVSRYTTRQVLASEMALQRNAAALAGDTRHGVKEGQIEKASAAFTLKPEQADALRDLTGKEGFAMLWGQAGTGKSHTLKAVRTVYENAGKSVIGLSWTNDVVQQMRGDGFRQANTISSEMYAIEHGRTAWTNKTVLIVDEAAMVSTDHLARLTAAAVKAGAKLILAGDDAQLSSIERGGMFETLRRTHGAAILKEVQRVKQADQQAAFGSMNEGQFLEALKTFDRAGGLHWSNRQSDTLKAMADRYSADHAADPDKRRFMFAYTNADVGTLNQHARALHREAGKLGDDRTLATKHGAADFAVGDRMQFTGNGRTQREKQAGLVNGRVGTVTAIDLGDDLKHRVTVELDAAKGEKPQRVSFTVGEDAKGGEFNSFKHGYAGTIYRGQGRTLDEVYVGHSSHWRRAASYVALTRHREQVHIFAARETAKDIEAMASGMARAENKRAATAYQLDDPTALQSILDVMARGEGRHGPQKAQGEARTAAAPKSADTGRAARVLDGVAGVAEKVIDTLADGMESLLGGASPAPPAAQPSAHEQRMAAFLQAERLEQQQRSAALRELGKILERENGAEESASLPRDRRRDGGQSL